jgi:exopolysaccharide production protein ExoQ
MITAQRSSMINLKPSPRWYYWVSGIFVLQATNALDYCDRLVYPDRWSTSGDWITQSFNVLLIATSLALFTRGVRKTRGIGLGGVLALMACSLLLLSALWSRDPTTTIRRGVVYLFVVVGAIGVAGNMDGDEFMDLLGTTCLLSAIASLVLLAVSPGSALMPDGSRDLRGIFSHKNFLGEVMAAGTLAGLHKMRAGHRNRARGILILIVFGGVALLAKSATSLLAIFAFYCVDGIITLCRKGGPSLLLGLFSIILLVPIAAIVAYDPDPLLEMIGKDPTLTGRTELWGYVINDIQMKPLLGWGYYAFWSLDNPAAMEISDKVQWFVPEAHNGLLEMLLNAGVVGTAFFVFLLFRNISLGLRCLRTHQTALAISTLLACGGIVLVGVSESILMEPLEISTTIFFATGMLCESAIRAAKPRRYPIALRSNQIRQVTRRPAPVG